MKTFLLSVALCLCGCTTFRSDQVKTDPDGTVTESHQVVRTFWDSKSAVAKLRASTTDKTQGLTVGSIDQESSGTNALTLIGIVVESAVRGAVTPGP